MGRQLSRSLPSEAGLENWMEPPMIVRKLSAPMSRYEMDFEELGHVGKGGYGSVFKVRNRLDGRFYAVKKIRLEMHDANSQQRVSREVKTMARLSAHQNVVRYYHAWVEMVTGPAALGCPGDSLDLSTTMSDSMSESQDESRPWKVLFIQMQLCTHSLRHGLKDPSRTVDILYIRSVVRQVSQGLLHMHLQGINFFTLRCFFALPLLTTLPFPGFIHRDIKPE